MTGKYYVYILKSQSTGRYYTRSTNNLTRRLLDHNRGKTISTKNKGPWVMVYSETFESRSEAVAREKQLKSYKGGNAFKKLVKGF